MPDSPDTRLFDEFAVPSYEEWYETTVKSLKGKPFEKVMTDLYEGFSVQPMYRQEDIADISHTHTLPGHAPYVRGTTAAGYVGTPWDIAQAIPYTTPDAFNDALKKDMARGQTAVYLKLDDAARPGYDPDNAPARTVGRNGVSIATLHDLSTALDGIDPETTPIFIDAGLSGMTLAALLAAWVDSLGKDATKLTGCIESDPLAIFASQSLPVSLSHTFDELAALVKRAEAKAPELDVIMVNSFPYHHAGANAVQELAVTIAAGVTYLRELTERGLSVDTIAQRMRFAFAISSDFFLEVAKLRAARILWQQVIAAYGGDSDSQKMTIHARTSDYNKTVYDPYVNMLRTTIEAFAGATGGAQSMQIAPFDHVLREPDDFSRRIARNQQLILQQEVNLTRLIDPAGGSYYTEYLTDELGKRAWALFQEIESAGGLVAALKAGTLQAQVADIADKRQQNLAKRRDVLVGLNMYASITEPVPVRDETDYEAIAASRAEAVKATRDDDAASGVSLDDPASLVEAFRNGASIGTVSAALRGDIPPEDEIEPLNVHRVAQPFEALRDRALGYRDEYGHLPQIFLANMGPLRQHKARADFTRGFFETGGFEILYPDGFDTADEAVSAALDSGAPAVVICSTDASYPEIVPALTHGIKTTNPEIKIILAGYPTDQVESYREAGIDEFIHIRANCYAINAWLHDQIIEEA